MSSKGALLPFRTLSRLSWAYAFFIVYGSLVPFEYRAATWDQALHQFAHIQWLDIDLESRADWVANLVLYVPFGFLANGALCKRSAVLGALLAAILGSVLAVGVEFAQIWAAPRTVSLNDILAEMVGTYLGIALWLMWGKRLVRTTQTVLAGGPDAVGAALALYVLAYSFISLFPFDFFVDAAEFHARLADPTAIVWIPQRFESLRGLLYLIVKGAIMMPIGAAMKLVWHRGTLSAALAGLAISGTLELAHWLEYSAQTDGISVLVSVVGAVAGNWLASLATLREVFVVRSLRACAWLAAPLYLVLLPLVFGWHRGLASRADIDATLSQLHWLPFYYHYFTSEANALASVMGTCFIFAPVGALIWAARLRPSEAAGSPRSVLPSVRAGLVVSTAFEVGGLLTSNDRPDPTNVLIAIAAAVFAQRGCEWLARVVKTAVTREAVPA